LTAGADAPPRPELVKGPSLKARALKLLSMREHTRLELERKLSPHAESPELLAQALDALQAKGFINEARVVESVLHRRAAKLGASRVRQELQAKGVADTAIAEAVEHLRSTELARAREVWHKKFGEVPQDPKERAKQIRFLISRGFGAEVVRRVVAGTAEL
jgi:regulatory protein